MEPMRPMDFGPKWWPDALGEPATSGAQNNVRYAFFPKQKRLAIDSGGSIQLYDSADYAISGVSQQQGSSRSLVFTSQRGDVDLTQLRKVDM
jgi:hypothetical protein